MHSHDAPRKPGQPGTLEQHCITYSKVAAAAGVSLLALAAPAEGKVVITTHINIHVTETVSLDLNHDGVPDLEFTRGGYSAENFCGVFLGFYSTCLSAKPLFGEESLKKRTRLRFKPYEERANWKSGILRRVCVDGSEGRHGDRDDDTRQLGRRST